VRTVGCGNSKKRGERAKIERDLPKGTRKLTKEILIKVNKKRKNAWKTEKKYRSVKESRKTLMT
jgi:hypothetical protein